MSSQKNYQSLKELREDYLLSAELLRHRISQLKVGLRKAMGKESVDLERRIRALRDERDLLLDVAFYLDGYYTKSSSHRNLFHAADDLSQSGTIS